MKITNNAAGPRGVNLTDGTTHWIEPGESHTFEKGQVADNGVHADMGGDKPAAAKDGFSAEDINSAVGMLDHKNDDHWTKGGDPSVEAVSDALGGAVTRAQIKEAAPDAKRAE
jgi:hypothetical protein